VTADESARAQQLLLQERAARLSQSEELQRRLAAEEGRGTKVQATASSLQVRDSCVRLAGKGQAGAHGLPRSKPCPALQAELDATRVQLAGAQRDKDELVEQVRERCVLGGVSSFLVLRLEGLRPSGSRCEVKTTCRAHTNPLPRMCPCALRAAGGGAQRVPTEGGCADRGAGRAVRVAAGAGARLVQQRRVKGTRALQLPGAASAASVRSSLCERLQPAGSRLPAFSPVLRAQLTTGQLGL
jgi:hypothetical protein